MVNEIKSHSGFFDGHADFLAFEKQTDNRVVRSTKEAAKAFKRLEDDPPAESITGSAFADYADEFYTKVNP